MTMDKMTDKEKLEYHIKNYHFEYQCRSDYKSDLSKYIVLISGVTSVSALSLERIISKLLTGNATCIKDFEILSILLPLYSGVPVLFLFTKIIRQIYHIGTLENVEHPSYKLMKEKNANLKGKITTFEKASISLQKYNIIKTVQIAKLRELTFNYCVIGIIFIILVNILKLSL